MRLTYPLGPLLIGITGLTLTAEELELLAHPSIGGVILFSRNYADLAQLRELVRAIHNRRTPPLLVAVDQEGGRVQRLRDGFTALPAPRQFGQMYDEHPVRARRLATLTGCLLAQELRLVGIDFSFTPVLDIDYERSYIIGNRAFHSDPDVIVSIATAFCAGLHAAGMAAVGKHFPGHGYVVADSHRELPVDTRSATALQHDLIPFAKMAKTLEGIMTAHVVYPVVDAKPASFSTVWLHERLRQKINFQGTIFSDDLDMGGAVAIGSPVQRARAALEAGCDMILVCNQRDAVITILDELAPAATPALGARLQPFYAPQKPPVVWSLADRQRVVTLLQQSLDAS